MPWRQLVLTCAQRTGVRRRWPCMMVRSDVAGAAAVAELYGHVAIAGIVRTTTRSVLSACRDGSLHAHGDEDDPRSGVSIPLVCALAWRAGYGPARQRVLCPLCMVLARTEPATGPRLTARARWSF
ncbi:hypothetical protein LQ327_02900 [Actinomycetospora endophytica]|uniref:Uncharacterized protein n=1 Tax=Actinomycetospora endophytica TaxID=2291215 RepID=A0ABS8P283_9PSEU|nr:hypothetical protein [Actinomycetospora endophytica]MCD2192345.1 hypothetical protein [Actinomycetospora endophytica]